MKSALIANNTIFINAPSSKVWEALTNPLLIKKYLFNTQTFTDWKQGSPIIWKGEWQGKNYQDKGKILKLIPEKLLQTSYWSSMSGLLDIPENYKIVTYKLKYENNQTRLNLTQDNNSTIEEKNHSEQNWKRVLEGIKKVAES